MELVLVFILGALIIFGIAMFGIKSLENFYIRQVEFYKGEIEKLDKLFIEQTKIKK